MYNFNYQYRFKSGNTPDGNYENKTVLTATFLFGQEVVLVVVTFLLVLNN